MKNSKDLLMEIQETMKSLGEQSPEGMKGFKQFMHHSKKDGALDKKTKEIIGVALSVVKQCEWCVSLHVKNALEAGATKEELLEACLIAAMMGGGPALMFSKNVLQAIEDLKQ